MSKFASTAVRLVVGSALLGSVAFAGAMAQGGGSIPDFSSNRAAWKSANGLDYTMVPGSPPQVTNDPAYPYVSNAEANRTGKQPTYRIANLNNPNIKQWAKDVMKKDNDEILAARSPTRRAHPASRGAFPRSGCRADRSISSKRPRWSGSSRAATGCRAASHERPAHDKPETVLVRRIGRQIRRRHAGRRYDRHERQDLRRQLPHAPYREAACRRALQARSTAARRWKST